MEGLLSQEFQVAPSPPTPPPKCVNARPQHQLPCSEEPVPLHCSTCWGDITWHLRLDPGELRPLCGTPPTRRPWQNTLALLPADPRDAVRPWEQDTPPLYLEGLIKQVSSENVPGMSFGLMLTDRGFRHFQGIVFNICTTNWTLDKVKSHRCLEWPALKGLKLLSP